MSTEIMATWKFLWAIFLTPITFVFGFTLTYNWPYFFLGIIDVGWIRSNAIWFALVAFVVGPILYMVSKPSQRDTKRLVFYVIILTAFFAFLNFMVYAVVSLLA